MIFMYSWNFTVFLFSNMNERKLTVEAQPIRHSRIPRSLIAQPSKSHAAVEKFVRTCIWGIRKVVSGPKENRT